MSAYVGSNRILENLNERLITCQFVFCYLQYRWIADERAAAVERVCHMKDSPGQIMALGGVPREQKMLKGHLPRVINHQVY